MQQLIIVGNVGKQAEVRQAPNGQAIGFSVAVNEHYKDKEGNKKEKTTWYKITVWKKLGESTSVAEYLKPGQPVSLVGRPYAEAYIKDGKAIAEQCVRVEARDLQLVGSPRTGTATAKEDEDTLHVKEVEDDNDLPF